ncbi:flotillin family protein [Loktanella sp. M215]|uniref:flotillin family protein n=1 Tax=Loktanella sp. M215 TaxID=2675431 RepID=UPI001EFEFB37|nr:flotillin domain-containing protein [Loktanella sp. M215]MCF7700914.1 flotillin [Loktanella sp. M215]
MAWFFVIVVLVIAAVLIILFLSSYYRKATREISVVRTGMGGQKVVLDGGCVALPFLHKVSEVNMRTSKLDIERAGAKSIITKDRLRVDVAAEFYVRVKDTVEGVATAAQALGGKSFRASDLEEILEGKLVNAMLSVAAGYTMDDLQDNRANYAREVSAMLDDNLGQNGLMLESMSLTRIDQTPFHALDENNAFNALGMRRLAEIIAVNKKERAVIEADADVSVRQSQLEATKRKLTITREEEEAMITQQREIEIARSRSAAETAEEQAVSEKRREAARINRDTEVRRQTLESELNSALKKSENTVVLARKRGEEALAEADAIAAKGGEAEAEERVRTIRETAMAERDKALALIRAAEQAQVDDTRVRSEADTIKLLAEAQAKATLDRAGAERDRMLSEAKGRAAMIEAENAQSPALIAMKMDEARLRTLPLVVERMMKPAEKIESIRINHMTGFDGAKGGRKKGVASAVNQVVDSVLSMALQLPAVQKLGEEVGMNIGDGVRGLSKSLDRKTTGGKPDKATDAGASDKKR